MFIKVKIKIINIKWCSVRKMYIYNTTLEKVADSRDKLVKSTETRKGSKHARRLSNYMG